MACFVMALSQGTLFIQSTVLPTLTDHVWLRERMFRH